MSPSQAGKFDFKLVALIRGGKQATIRLGGVVDLPAVTLDIERFNFHSGFEVRTTLEINTFPTIQSSWTQSKLALLTTVLDKSNTKCLEVMDRTRN